MSPESEKTNCGLIPEFESMRNFFLSLKPSVKGLEDMQRVKTLTDGTKIIVNHYQSVENGGTPEELETFFVSAYKKNCGGISFTITKNGLVTVDVSKEKMVTLRSHLWPRPGENLQVTYDKADSSKTPLEVFRQAAKPLVAWLDEIKTTNQWTSPPVAIRKKSLI